MTHCISQELLYLSSDRLNGIIDYHSVGPRSGRQEDIRIEVLELLIEIQSLADTKKINSTHFENIGMFANKLQFVFLLRKSMS